MQQLPNKWDLRLLELAKLVSTWSKDTSSQMGACITTSDRRILSVGYNGMCRHVSDDVPERHERPLKYKWFEHAERNAIYNAAASGVSISGCTMHCMCTPCCDCARAIIQSGLSRVVWYEPSESIKSRWAEDLEIAKGMLTEAGVFFVEVPT